MGELIIPLDFLLIEESLYDVIIGLPTMVRLRARPGYNRMLLKIHVKGDSEILNYEYERERMEMPPKMNSLRQDPKIHQIRTK